MSSSKTRNILLVAFVVLTLVFGSLFAYEFFQVQRVKSPSTITSTTTVTSTSFTAKGTNTTTTPHIGNLTTTSTSVQSSSLTSNTTTTSALNSATIYTNTFSSITVTCIQTCSITAESAGANLRVLSDSGSPIAGAQISGHEISGEQIIGTQTITCGNCNFTHIATDSSGLISLPGSVGPYNLTITYQGHLYNISIPMYPVTLTEVTLHIPSGVFSIEVIAYGDRPSISGPTFAATYEGLRLNVTLGSYTVKAGEYQPIRLAFLGSGAWNASYAEVSTVVNNSTGENVWNMTENIPDLYSIPYTNLLQGYIAYVGWIPRTNDPNIPIAPGEYTITISANVDGHLLKVQGTVQVTG
jgi:hypothetical protein